jgi:Fe2+/Zn2+ uptake regulation proteins
MNELVKFEQYLRTHGQKMTRPRRIILKAFIETEGHLTTEDILREAKKVDPPASARQQSSGQYDSSQMPA